ncbi:MAG: methyl-accepting chemotaxis protein [bacterium]|nr:methyl-accepting chemotaxis protein [bacterium]
MTSIQGKLLAITLAAVLTMLVGAVIAQLLSAAAFERSRDLEIRNAIASSTEHINSLTRSMEQNAQDLAIAGSLLYEVRRSGGADDAAFDRLVQDYLIEVYDRFPEAVGGGIWYDAFRLDPDRRLYGPYAFREDGRVVFTWDLNTAEYDYLNQDWYKLALPEKWDRRRKREHDFYWTAPYVDEAGTNALLVTVDAFMYDRGGRIIGISTVDWALSAVTDLMQNTRITEGTESFLVDPASSLVVQYSGDPEQAMRKVDTIPWLGELSARAWDENEKAREARAASSGGSIPPAVTGSDVKQLAMQPVLENGLKYQVYYTRTDTGYLYGVMIPTGELAGEIDAIRNYSLLAMLLVAVALLALLHYAVRRTLLPLQNLEETVRLGSEGDLTVRADDSAGDEIGRLAGHFNEYMSTVQEIIRDIKETAETLGAASHQIGKTSGDLIKVSQTQAENISGISAATREMAQTISLNADNARQTEGIAGRTSDQVEEGAGAVRNTVLAIQKMGERIRVIEDIAAETNMLALNAAVEAVRAGEYGKGFSVVAAEVQKLAESSQAASHEISELVSSSVSLADRAGKLFGEIEPEVSRTAELVQNIALGSGQQEQASRDIEEGMQELNRVAQTNAGSAELLSETAQKLDTQAAQLQTKLGFFKVQ